MPFYSYIFLIIVLLIVTLLIRALILWKRNIPIELFAEALQNENSGHFEEALITYETALNEVKKIRFSNISLKNKITEKLKVLHTLIEYKNNLHFTR